MSPCNEIQAALSMLYTGKCTVTEKQPYEAQNGLTKYRDVTVLENQPCRLSCSSAPAVTSTDGIPALTQEIKLFLPPGVAVKPGSKITVTQAGKTEAYCQSGQPAVYESHTEIMLNLWKEHP
ncbi:MAG TPA: hypothetical protein DEP60_04330 [Ruminococcaceae bacterium]|jgi:hypothetical protein|nr:hypothetical protein [Oscillospiraceae bacterium]